MSMDAKTLTALRGSIAKWRAIVDGTGEDHGADNCPLCEAFFDGPDDDDPICVGCPVAEARRPNCAQTPYWNWRELFSVESRWPLRAGTIKQKVAAKAELDFLISLLPEGEAP